MPIKVGTGLSIARDHIIAATEAVGQAKKNIDLENDKIGLALVFSSTDFSHQSVLKTISSLLGGIPIVGSSGLAIISNQGVFKYGLLIILFSLPEDIGFSTAYVKDINTKPIAESGKELGEKLLHNFTNSRRDLGIIFSDTLTQDTSGLIYGLEQKMGISFPLIGACVSDVFTLKRNYLYYEQQILNEAACGILWGGKLNFAFSVKHGWLPLGKPRYVTKSQGNIINTIDSVPAVKIFEEYLAKDDKEIKKDLKRMSMLYPIGMNLPGEEEYLLRSIVSIKEDGSLLCQGDVPQGSQIRLMIATKDSCLRATSLAAEELTKSLDPKKIGFVFIFDSASRYELLGRQIGKEIQVIQERLGKEIPIAGLCTHGEVTPLKSISYLGKPSFHNQTIVMTAIGD